jgi:thiamine-phosphate pyrophosphorylase
MVEEAVAGGASIVQYRSKSPDKDRKTRQALAIRAVCNRHSIPFIVNDEIDLALEIGADGVHIGSNDSPVVDARKRLGDRILGVSCYNREDLALEAEKLGADYVAFGSFFPSITKPDAVRAPLALLQMTSLSIKIPVIAIGGITLDNGAALVACGADALAVVTALFDTPDIRTAAKQFSELFSI